MIIVSTSAEAVVEIAEEEFAQSDADKRLSAAAWKEIVPETMTSSVIIEFENGVS